MFKYTDEVDFSIKTSHGLIASKITQKEKILEFGCGKGDLAKHLKSKHGCSVVGIDISEQAIAMASEHLSLGIVADAETGDWETKIKDETFDVLIFSDILEHLRTPADLVKRALKYLKNDGRVIFSVPNIAHGDIVTKLLAGRFDYTSIGLLDNTHIHFFALENVLEFCKECGLSISILDATYAMPGTTEQKSGDTGYTKQFQYIQKTSWVYQFVCEAYKRDFAEENHIECHNNIKTTPHSAVAVYYDLGDGITTENKVDVEINTLPVCKLSIAIKENTKKLRLDFAEDAGYGVKDAHFFLDGVEVTPSRLVGAHASEKLYVLDLPDSQFYFDVDGQKEFSASATLIPLCIADGSEDVMACISDNVKSIRDKNEKLEAELKMTDDILSATKQHAKNLEDICVLLNDEKEEFRKHHAAAVAQRDDYKNRLADAEYAYSVISNSFYWKITKPLRFTTDLIKKIAKKIPPLRALAKFLKCLKQNGIKYTVRKIKEKIRNRQDYSAVRRPIYTPEELEAQKNEKFSKDIKFSILVPLYNTPEVFLKEMIQSVIDQTYSNWELCLADGSDKKHAHVKHICNKYAAADSRIIYKKLEKNMGISLNTNACIEMATGDYIGLFDHDDLLHPAALYEVMHAICDKDADFIYTDENTFHKAPKDAYCPHFKPDYAPDTLRTNNYICHFSVFKKSLIDLVGPFRPECDGSQDYDMVLRLTEKAEKIVHIPKILYYWRAHAGSVATDVSAKPYVIHAAHKALADHLERVGLKGRVENTVVPSMYRIRYEIKNEDLVSIIIANKDHSDDLRKCLNSIFEKTTYKNYEIIVVENNSTEQQTFDYYEEIKNKHGVKVVRWDGGGKFNYSAINNLGVRESNGKYILLLNNDTEVISPDWITEMVMFAQRNDVGAVGAKLYYPDDTIQHAGLGIGLLTLAGHYFRNFPRQHPGYMGRLIYAHNVSAVTAACVMIRRDVWDEVGGLDETFEVAFNDVDICMQIRRAGYLIVWTPFAELYHYESKSRGLDSDPQKRKRFLGEVQRFQKRWRAELDAGDPYYNPNFTLEREDFGIK